jgi:hypothetical protein
MTCRVKTGALVLLVGVLLQAATLQKLGLDDMTQKSTAIVRARVTGSYAAAQGSIIYTHYQLHVSDRWKGEGSASLDVVVPGGTAAGRRQSFSGAPKLATGAEYVLFLWTGPSGMTHIMGLSQGVFDLKSEDNGEPVASHAASGELMLDSAGRQVQDRPMVLRLGELRQRVSRAVTAGGRK